MDCGDSDRVTTELNAALAMHSVSKEIAESVAWGVAFELFKNNPAVFKNSYAENILNASIALLPSCAFIQFLSKCLKLKRGNSHPERDIGRTAAREDIAPLLQESERLSATALIADIAASMLPRIAALLGSVPGYYAYFALILVKDLLKEQARTFAPQVAGLLASFARHCSYGPCATKFTDLALLIIHEDTVNSCELEHAMHILEGALSAFVLLADEQLLRTPELGCADCRAVQSVGPCGDAAAASLLLCSLRLLSRVAAARLFPEATAEDISQLSGICGQANVLLEKILARYNVESLLTALSESDPSLLLVLLDALEIKLRVDIITSSQGTARDFAQLNQILQRHRLDPLNLFAWFITMGLCSDMAVLVDLITGSETVALKYILRALKFLKSVTIPTFDLLTSRNGIDNISPCLRELASRIRKLNKQRMLPFSPDYLLDSIGVVVSRFSS